MSCYSPLIKAIENYIAKVDDDLEDTLEGEGYLAAKETVDAATSFEDAVASALTDETALFVEALKDSDSVEDFLKRKFKALKNDDTLAEQLKEIFIEAYGDTLPSMSDIYISSIDNEATVKNLRLRTVDWMISYSEKIADKMKLDSQDMIENILTTSMDEGEGVAEALLRIQDSGIRDEYYRARRVALTEMLTANRAAANESYVQSPAVEQKAWKHTGSYRNKPRQNHVDMDGQTVDANEKFTLKAKDGSVWYPNFPGDWLLPPGERINCHCISQPVVNNDILGLSLEERRKMQQAIIDADDEAWKSDADEDAIARADAWREAHS